MFCKRRYSRSIAYLIISTIVVASLVVGEPKLMVKISDVESGLRIPQEYTPHPGDVISVKVQGKRELVRDSIITFGKDDYVVRKNADEWGTATFTIPQGAIGEFTAYATLLDMEAEQVVFPVQNNLGIELVTKPWRTTDACEGTELAVRVRDESGNTIPAATVWFGEDFELTGLDGIARHQLPEGTANPLLTRAMKAQYEEAQLNVSVGTRKIQNVVVHPQKSDDPRKPWKYGTVCRGGEIMVKINTECFPESELFEVFVEDIFIGFCAPEGSERYSLWEDRNGNGKQDPGEIVQYCNLALPLSVGPGQHGVSVFYKNETVGEGGIVIPEGEDTEYDWRCGEDPDTTTGDLPNECWFFVSSSCVANRCFHSWGRNSGGEVFSTIIRTLADDLPWEPGIQVCPDRPVFTARFGGMDLRCSNGVFRRNRGRAPVYARIMDCPLGRCGENPLRTPGEIISMDQTNSICKLYVTGMGWVQGIGLKAELKQKTRSSTCWFGWNHNARDMSVKAPGDPGEYKLFFDAVTRICDNPRVTSGRRYWACPDCKGENAPASCAQDASCMYRGRWVRKRAWGSDGWQIAAGEPKVFEVIPPRLFILQYPQEPLCPGAAIEPVVYHAMCIDPTTVADLMEWDPETGTSRAIPLGECGAEGAEDPLAGSVVVANLTCQGLVVPEDLDFIGGRTYELALRTTTGNTQYQDRRVLQISGRSLSVHSIDSPVCTNDTMRIPFVAQCTLPPSGFFFGEDEVAGDCASCAEPGVTCRSNCTLTVSDEIDEGWHRFTVANEAGENTTAFVEVWKPGSLDLREIYLTTSKCKKCRILILDVYNPGPGEVPLMGLSDQAERYVVPELPACTITADSDNPISVGPGASANLTFNIKCNVPMKQTISIHFNVTVFYSDKCGCSQFVDGGRQFVDKYCKATDSWDVVITYKGTGAPCKGKDAKNGYCELDDPRTDANEEGVCLPLSGSGDAPCVGSLCGTVTAIETVDEAEQVPTDAPAEETTIILAVTSDPTATPDNTTESGEAATDEPVVVELDPIEVETLPGQVIYTPITINNPEDESMNITITIMEQGKAVVIKGSDTEMMATVKGKETVRFMVPVSAPASFSVSMEAVPAVPVEGEDKRIKYVLPVGVVVDTQNKGKIVCDKGYECVSGTHCSFQHCCPVRDLPWFWSFAANGCSGDLSMLEVPSRNLNLALGTEILLPISVKNPYSHEVEVEVSFSGGGRVMATLGVEENILAKKVSLLPGEQRIVLARLLGTKVGRFDLVVETRCDEAGCALTAPAQVAVLVTTDAALLGEQVEIRTAPGTGAAEVAFLALLSLGYLYRRD